MKPGWRLLGVVAIAGAATGAWLGGPALGRRLDFFRIRRVEFVGMRYLAPAVALDALQLGPNASVFDDLVPYQRRVYALKGVQRVDVARRLPGTLVVRLSESVPVALAPAGRVMALMDSAGRILPFDPARAAPDLPIAERADERIGRLLRRMQQFHPALFARVTWAGRSRNDVVLVVDGRRLLFRPGASAEEMRAVTAVAEHLARNGRTYTELDGRFAGQVVVRGTAGRGPGA